MLQTFRSTIGDRELVIETGKLAHQASGAVTVRYGDTVVLVTACVSDEKRNGGDFIPLTVDYEERHYAAGKIPGSFIRREARPSQDAILADRLIDRAIRPLFPKGFRNDIQVIITVLSTDQENDPDIIAMIGASCALCISEVPFDGPVASVRVGFLDSELVLNPTYTQLSSSSLDLVVAGTGEAVVMVEAEAKEVPENLIVEAMRFGQSAMAEIIALQKRVQEACGKPKMHFVEPTTNPEAEAAVVSLLDGRLDQVMYAAKTERGAVMAAIEEDLCQQLGDRFSQEDIAATLQSRLKKLLRETILDKGVRADGRRLNEVRPITCEVSLLPRTHGSALFVRGETQVLTTTTLGSTRQEQLIDTISQEETKRFMHHYNFPPFSVGEVGRVGAPGRRAIGHGALAERALLPVLPSEEDFPYTIRLVSEVLSSNGSTSMASVCASSLALMDAGVGIPRHVAGVAMGLVAGGEKYAVLTDIQGLEDAYGDMDFKAAGTANGITALQMDIKLKQIPYEVVEEAIKQASEARSFILGKMSETIAASRPELSQYAPRVYKITIPADRIGAVIGPGGKMIRSITEETGTTIDVENDGTVLIGSVNPEGAQKAIAIIEGLTKPIEVGATYTGKVTRVENYGAFVEILPGREGMVHISELADYRVPSVEDVVKLGDEIMVMVTEIDHMGRINLSRRAVFQGLSKVAKVKDTRAGEPSQRPPQGARQSRQGGEQRRPPRGRPPRRRPPGN
ncbi:MAG: polyribonucleotide nucleotidyltransferase [Chloroflexota bacterium]|nr:polyribonucleotide nucleotidyltransferase [Chloroflexota bacterium]